MKRTPNYGLPIVENNDRYSKEEQNNAMNIIDTELGSMSEAFRDTLNDIDNKFEEVKEFEEKIQADYDSLKKVIISENVSVDLQNQINTVSMSLENIIKTKQHIIYISNLDGYDKNDISKTLNNITFKEGYTYIINDIECISLNQININLPHGANLILDSKIRSHSSFLKIEMEGGNRVYIKEIYADNINLYDYGLHIIKGNGCNIDIGSIKHFKKGLILKPIQEWDYIQFCKINYGYIVGDISIDISVTGENTWVNENTFNGGGLEGRININMYKDFNDTSFRSLINNNKFYNLSVNSTEECVKIAKSSGESNYFYNIRTWEQEEVFNGRYYIEDNGGSNYFECQSGLPYERLKLGLNSKLDGVITGEWDNSTSSFPLIGLSAIGDIDLNKPYIVTNISRTVYADFSKGDFNLYTVTKLLSCSMNNSQTGTIHLKNTLFFRNNVFYFRKGGWDNNTHVTLVTPTSKSVRIEKNGLYLICLSDNYDYFEVIKLFEGEGLTPS